MKSKTGSKCSICTGHWVSSIKGATRDFESYRSTQKQILTKRFMKLHENYLNPGPLTDSGFSRPVRYQANLPESDRASVVPSVSGQTRLMAISGERSPGIERGLAYVSSPGGTELKTYAGNPGSLNLYPDFNPDRILQCHDLTEFRKRNAALGNSPVKAELVLFHTESNGNITLNGIAELLSHSTFKRCGRIIIQLFCQILKMPSLGHSYDKLFERWQETFGQNWLNCSHERWQKTIGLNLMNHLPERWQKTLGLTRLSYSLKRWRKTMGLNRLNHSLIKLGFLCEIEVSLLKNSKLIVC